jgi:hypothetical protein
LLLQNTFRIADQQDTIRKQYAVREDLLPVGHMSASDTANRISKFASPQESGAQNPNRLHWAKRPA